MRAKYLWQNEHWPQFTWDTALRDIDDLIRKGILRRAEEGGRSTNYELIED